MPTTPPTPPESPKQRKPRPPRTAYVDLYVSYGISAVGVTVNGRVLAGRRPALGSPEDRRRSKLRSTWRLFDTDELPDVPVEVTLLAEGEARKEPPRTIVATTDSEGFFAARFEAPPEGAPLPPPGMHVARAAVHDPSLKVDPIESPVLLYEAGDGLAVISDIDDTVLASDVRSRLRLLKRVIFSSPGDLVAHPGAADLFQRFAAAGAPLVFISGSPWNLEPRLRSFLALRGFPTAAVLLKDLGVGRRADSLFEQERYKGRRIAEVMEALPERRFVLLGDSGERDPEIYAKAIATHPGRVAAVYIRRVAGAPETPERFAGATLFDHFSEVAADLGRRGLLPAV